MCYISFMETIGIRELRQNASRVIEAAEQGTAYRVTNHGKDTGVMISRPASPAPQPLTERTGATPDQIARSGVYDQPKPAGYEQAMLDIVEHGRDQSGRVGDR